MRVDIMLNLKCHTKVWWTYEVVAAVSGLSELFWFLAVILFAKYPQPVTLRISNTLLTSSTRWQENSTVYSWWQPQKNNWKKIFSQAEINLIHRLHDPLRPPRRGAAKTRRNRILWNLERINVGYYCLFRHENVCWCDYHQPAHLKSKV